MDKDTNTTLARDKVLILYILNTLNKNITDSDLFKILSPINNINYFYFKQLLSDLVDSSLVGSYSTDEEEKQTVYEIL